MKCTIQCILLQSYIFQNTYSDSPLRQAEHRQQPRSRGKPVLFLLNLSLWKDRAKRRGMWPGAEGVLGQWGRAVRRWGAGKPWVLPTDSLWLYLRAGMESWSGTVVSGVNQHLLWSCLGERRQASVPCLCEECLLYSPGNCRRVESGASLSTAAVWALPSSYAVSGCQQ